MLELGHGWGISLADGTLIASTLVLPYEHFAWISMVLVLPEHRRRGYASRLLRLAIADLEHRGQTPVLDATPAGRAVYREEGFRDTWTFKRFFLRDPISVQMLPAPAATYCTELSRRRQITRTLPVRRSIRLSVPHT